VLLEHDRDVVFLDGEVEEVFAVLDFQLEHLLARGQGRLARLYDRQQRGRHQQVAVHGLVGPREFEQDLLGLLEYVAQRTRAQLVQLLVVDLELQRVQVQAARFEQAGEFASAV